MAIQAPPTMSTVLADYIQLRRNGQSMDNAVNELREAAFALTREERKQLGQVVNEWETRYGAHPRSAPPMLKPEAAQQLPPLPPQPKPSGGPTPFGTSFLDPSKLPASLVRPGDQVSPCPRCGKPCPRGAATCQFCNQSLMPTPLVTRKLESSEAAPKIPVVSATYFGPNSTLLLWIQGNKKPVEAYPRTQLVVGRASPMMPKPVNVDLTAYNAEGLGVSRNHAQLRWQDNMLFLSDLKTANGTFVNELQLYPGEARVLRSGDEVRMGKMVMKITFKH